MILEGDCREVMRTLDASSIDAIVTDPPYELGFMGKGWDRSGVAFDPDTWRAALRVLKPGGHLLAFSGSRTYHRMVCAIEDAGFEVRDQIVWIYGSGFPKSRNLDGEWQGWSTALKPAHEPIVLARKPLATRTVASNVVQFGTGALNIDACRVGADVLPAQKAGQAKLGTFKRIDMLTPERVGRWPANLIHDGSPEEWSEFFYCAKASKRDRDDGLSELQDRAMGFSNGAQAHGEGYDKGQGIGLNRVVRRKNTHPTVKPTELMRYLCRLVTPPGGTVLDPFAGSGSTGRGAVLEGFSFIGAELSPEYADIARRRIEAVLKHDLRPARDPDQLALWNEEANHD